MVNAHHEHNILFITTDIEMLEKIIAFSIKNKFLVILMTLALIMWGMISATKLPIDAVPDITNNQVQIITLCPTLASQEVEQLVTYPIEQTVSNLPDVEELRSISRFGLSVITVVFDESVDIYFARQLISEKLKEAAERIPKGIGQPEMAPVSTGLGEIYQYIIHPKKGSEHKYSPADLRTMQDWIVARQLYGTPGIAEVNSFGGQLKQYEVAVNPDRLLAMDVTIPEIFTALEKNNENTGGAYIDKKPNAYFIRGVGLIGSFDDIKNIVVKSNPNGIPILIKDVADVRFGGAVRYGALTYNGEKDAVGGLIMMLKGANSAEVVNRIKEKLPTIQKSLPADVTIEPFLDRTDLVNRAISTVEKNLIEGALIVIFVLVLFLGNFRAGLIVASAIPLSMLFALGMMNVFGISANLMSLGAIDFGLIVDGAVIIVEATMHHLGLRKITGRLTQDEMDKEVFESASKIRNSAAFGEIIILIVYIPILTLIGTEGKMFRPMAQTVGLAIAGALILSLTYIPMMCSLFLSKNISHKETFSDRMMRFFQGIYTPLLEKAIRFKNILVAATVLIFAITVFIFSRMGGEFIPTLQEGDFAFHCILPQGTSLSQSLETSMQASRILREFDEVRMVVGKTGSAEVPTDPMPPEATDMMVILKPPKEWKRNISYNALAEEMMHKLESLPGVFFESSQPIQMRFNELMTGIKQDVAVKVFGENLDTLLLYANKIAPIISSVKGTTEPSVERIAGLPQIVIRYNRSQMANYGINIQDINRIVSTAFAGGSAGVVYENERKFDLVVRLDSTNRSKIDDVSHLYIPAANGTQIPLSQVAEIKLELGPVQISREDGKRRIVVGFNVKDRDVESVVTEIREQLDKNLKLSEGYYYTFGGTFESLQAASKRLMIAVPVALALIFLLLYLTFGSASQALLIFTAIPMSAIGGVFALLARGMPFSISAGIGFIALFGVAVLNGIVLIATFNQLKKDGMENITERIIEGTKIRLRPVLMTATVASLGFLPMALSHGAGAEVQKPLATVVIGGLLTATFLTLFVLPLLYMIFFTGKRISIKPLAILPFLILLADNVDAQKVLTEEEVVSIALKNNSGIQSQDLGIMASSEMRKTVFELPATAFNVQYGQFNSINNDIGFQVDQSIQMPAYFSTKKQLYNAQVQADQMKKDISVNELRSKVRSLYAELRYLSFARELLLSVDSLYNDFIKVADIRYRTGETNLLEKMTAETRRGQFSLMLQQNAAEYINTYQSLKALMYTPEEFAPIVPKDYAPVSLTIAADTSMLESNPALRYLYQQTVVAEKDKKFVKTAMLPELSVGYFNQSITGAQNIDGNEVFFGRDKRFQGINVGVSVPLIFSSNAAKLRSLTYRGLALQKEAEQSKALLQSQLLNEKRTYQRNLERLEFFTKTALPNADTMINTATSSFRHGEIGYIEYLQALQSAAEVKLDYLDTIRQLNQNILNINYLLNQ